MTTTSPGEPVLSITGLSKRFGAVQALKDIDFDVRPGEVVALVGDNGAGKSTLVKAIAGVYVPDSGRVSVDGREVSISSPAESQRLGIATVYQDLALCDNLDIVQNMFLGREETNGLTLDEVERVHLLLRLSTRLRQKHDD